MNFARLSRQLEKLIVDNSPVILTAVGVVGTIATAYFTHKSTVKAVKILDAAEEARSTANLNDMDLGPLGNKEKTQLIWKEYIKPAAICSGTVVAIVMSNHISTKRVAALAAAYSVAERSYTEYKDKFAEKLGINKEQSVADGVAEDRMVNDPVSGKTVIITDGGEHLCYDKMSGRYFKSSMDSIKAAVNEVNRRILSNGSCSLTQFYDEIGIDSNGFSDFVGWNYDSHLKVRFSTMISDDGRPCIVMDYECQIDRKYDRER